MMRRSLLPTVLLLVLFLFPLTMLAPRPVRVAQEPAHTYTEGTFGKGELKYINGLPVLTVEGTPQQIGDQIGRLTTKPLTRMLTFPRKYLADGGYGDLWPVLVEQSKKMLPQFPADHRKELEALANNAGLSYDLAVAGNTFPDMKKIGGCATLIIEDKRSATHAPLFGRNLDYPTLGFLHEYSLVTVYRPRGKHAFVSIGFPGLVGCISGMNDAGLALATLEVYSSKDDAFSFNPKGTPYALCYRRVLEECTTVAQAEKLLRSMKHTTMNSLAICDSKGGAVFEITSKSLVVRRSIDHVCCCTNHFCTRELATRAGSRCWRLPLLEKCRQQKQLGLADVARKLDDVNQGRLTLQTMVFEPAALKLHLAIGKCPASKLPLKTLELSALFKKRLK